MPSRRSPSSRRLLALRARAQRGLLASAAATIALAVATVGVALGWLARAGAGSSDVPPGVDAAELEDLTDAGAVALASASPALILLVALVAGTAVAQLASLVAAAREHETATIRARGFSRGQGWATDAAEALGTALLGGLVGAAAAVGVALVLGIPVSASLAAWPWMLATTLALAAVFAIALRRSAGARTSARAVRVTTAAAVVVVLLAAALVGWQLPSARGEGFDPVVAAAPAVLLLAGALVALAVFGAAATAWARPAASGAGVRPGYPARQVARRIPIYAVAVLLVAVTVAQAVFASAFSATWRSMTVDSAAIRAGADLRVDLAPQSASPGDIADAAAVTGVDAASGALGEDIEIGATDARLVSLPAARIDAVVTTAGGLVDPAVLAAAADVADTARAEPIPLGDSATGVRVTVLLDSGGAAVPAVTLGVVLMDAAGTPTGVTLDDSFVPNPDGTVTLLGETTVPDGAAPWSILAVTASLAPTAANRSTTATVQRAEALEAGDLDIAGSAGLDSSAAQAVLWLGDDGGFAEGDAPPVGAAVSRELASRLGVSVGDPLEFRYAGSGRRGEAVIASLVDVVPGTASPLALFVPMESLTASQLQRGTSIVPPNGVWAAGSTTAAAQLSEALGDRAVATAGPGVTADVVGALVPGWWIATAGAILLALVAALAIAQTLAIARRGELGVLRALGITAARQARMRAGELAGVFAASVILGAGAGALASWLIVPELVRAITPGILPIAGGLSFAWDGAGLAIAALVAGLALVVAASAVGVARAARTASVGEDAR